MSELQSISSAYYLSSTAGTSLTNAISTMIERGELDEEKSRILFLLFEDIFPKELRNQIYTLPTNSKAYIQGELETYNMDRNAWRVDGSNCDLRAFKSTGKVQRARLYFK